MKLRDLAVAVGGDVSGDGTVEITAVADLSAPGPGALIPVLDDRRTAEADAGPGAALLLSRNAPTTHKPALRCPNPRLALARAIGLLHPPAPRIPGIDPRAVISAGATVGPGVFIGPYAVLDEGAAVGRGAVVGAGAVVGRGAVVGEESVIHPRAVIYDGSVLGRRVIVHGGAVIGSDGFGYAEDGGRRVKIPHAGTVVVEDDVEVGANTTIDRATLGETRIGAGTKIDNLVQIGHNVRIGRDVVIVAQTGISGSVTIGDRAVLAGQVGITDHVTIGSGAQVLGRSMVTKDVPAGAVVSGSPAGPHREALREQAALRRLSHPPRPGGPSRGDT